MYQSFMPQYQPYQVRQEFMPQPQQSVMSQQAAGFSIRPVASRAEAEAAQIPFDGSTHFFCDTASGKIYAKTFNALDGTAPLVSFIREEVQPAPRYVTLDEFNAFKEELMAKKPAGKGKKTDDEQ